MRNRCLPKLGCIYLGKSKKGEIATVKAKEASKLKVEECYVRKDVEDKSKIQNSSAPNKNSILREKEVITAEGKEMADDKFDDTLSLEEILDTEKDEKSNEKLTGERGSVKVDVNSTEAEQDSTQDQAKLRQEYERGVPEVSPKSGAWDKNDPVLDGYAHIFHKVRDERHEDLNERCRTMKATRGALNDEFYKVKTFVLGGVKSGGKRLNAITWSRFFSVK